MNIPYWIVALFFGIAVWAGPLEDARFNFERGHFRDGDRILTEWLAENPEDESVREAFYLLEQENSIGSRNWPALLEKWAAEENVRGRFSLYYGGIAKRLAGDFDGAIEDFLALLGKDVLTGAVQIQLVETYLAADRFAEAGRIMEVIRSANLGDEVEVYLRGLEVRFWLKKENPKRALAMFEGLGPDVLGDEDLFHGGLAALQAGDGERLMWFRKQMEARKLEATLGELIFEEGLFLADHSDTAAFEKLAAFLRAYPDHPRAADAEIALAEQHLNQVPPQPQAARDRQANARRRELSLSQSERLDYSVIWTERIAGDLPAVVKKANRFLGLWRRSDRRPEVMMMLGRAHFELGNYPDAIVVFEQLSALHGESEMVEVALFFAAKAASLTMTFGNHEKAQTLWEAVAERGGPLAAYARQEQGLLYLAGNRLDDALAVFEKVLNGAHEMSDELQIAALCDSGHAVFLKALATDNDEVLLRSAMSSFLAAENHPAATTAWKYQARVRRGKCLEALGEAGEALALYFSIVRESTMSSSTLGLNVSASIPIEQFNWLYRAGFSAIELLEGQENWKDAVKLAELLEDTGGSRAIEARERANRLRLKWFVWDGDE